MGQLHTGYLILVPLFRYPEIPKVNPSIIGRWHGTGYFGGDGTGGACVQTWYMENLYKSFGQFARWNIKFVHMGADTALAGSSVGLHIYTGESSSDSNQPINWDVRLRDDARRLYNDSNLPDYDFGYSRDPTYPTSIEMNIYPNTNGVIYNCSIGGYIVDERML